MRGWLAVLVLLVACYSTSLVQEPRALPQGAVRGAVGANGLIGRGPTGPQLALRVGLGAGTEARLKLQMFKPGYEGGINVQPWDSERVGIFLMPHYRYYSVMEDYDQFLDESPAPERKVHAFGMPSLVVFHVGRSDLFLGPDTQAGTRDRRGFFALGGHAGAAIAAGRHVHFVFEGALLGTLAGTQETHFEYDYNQKFLTVGRLTGELAISVSFGSAYFK